MLSATLKVIAYESFLKTEYIRKTNPISRCMCQSEINTTSMV